MNTPTAPNRISQYGSDAFAAAVKSTSFLEIDDKTKRFSPTGGVIIPISISRVTMIPNQMGSNPKLVIIGKVIGSVINSSDMPSKKHPKIDNNDHQ